MFKRKNLTAALTFSLILITGVIVGCYLIIHPENLKNSQTTSNSRQFQDNFLSFEYPSSWNLSKNNGFYTILDNQNNPKNQILIDIDDRKEWESPNQGVSNSENDLIERAKKYEVGSTSGLGDYDPEQISQTPIQISGAKGISYQIHLKNPHQLPYDTANWVYVIKGNNLIKFKLGGKDQNALTNFLNSVKFQ